MVIPIKDHQSFVSDTTRVVHFRRYHPIDMQKLTDQKAQITQATQIIVPSKAQEKSLAINALSKMICKLTNKCH